MAAAPQPRRLLLRSESERESERASKINDRINAKSSVNFIKQRILLKFLFVLAWNSWPQRVTFGFEKCIKIDCNLGSCFPAACQVVYGTRRNVELRNARFTAKIIIAKCIYLLWREEENTTSTFEKCNKLRPACQCPEIFNAWRTWGVGRGGLGDEKCLEGQRCVWAIFVSLFLLYRNFRAWASLFLRFRLWLSQISKWI